MAGVLLCGVAQGVTPVNHGKYVLVPADNAAAAAGHFVSAGADNAAVLTDDYSEASVWQWDFVSGTATVAGHYTLTNVATGGFLYTEVTDGSAALSATDVAIKRTNSAFFDGTHCFSANGTYLSAAAGGRLTAQADEQSASAFLILDYDAAMSAAEMLDKATTEVAMLTARAKAVAEMRPLFEASYSGMKYADQVLADFGLCSSEAEIESTKTEVRRTAIRMLESDMESGATWQQKSTGLFITYADDAYRGVEAVGTDGLWYAEFTDNGNTIMDNRKFYMRSNRSRRYLVAPVAATGAVTGVAARSEATLWRVTVVAGGLAITVDADNTNSRLLYPDATGILSVNSGDDTAGATVYAGDISTYGYGVNSIRPTGPTEEVGGATVTSSVNAIELTVERGSVATADGQITLVYRKEDMSGNVTDTTLESFNASDLSDPVQKTIDVDYYNKQGQHISGSKEVDIYTIALKEPYTDGGDYIARAGLGCFTLNGSFSEELAGFTVVASTGLWDVEVTPAEGKVDAITRITLNGPSGVYANPVADADAVITVRLDGATVAEYPVADFAEGGKYDSYDIDADNPDWFTIDCNFTDAGRYSLLIPVGFFVNNAGKSCSATTVVWEIDDSGAIRGVEADATDATAPLYDLQGRRVTRPVPGRIYLQKGGKMRL